MAKHPSSPSASSPARKSPQPTPAGDAIDLSAAAAATTTTAASGPNASSSSSPPAGDAIDISAAPAVTTTVASGPNASSSSPPAGFVFMCSGATKPQCFSYRVLGLPRGRLDDVSRIRRGAALFLYDFDSKYLYGPYRADSDGGLALEPAAFQGRYPAQVKFTIDGDFMPIPESSVRSAIKENYSRGKFCPELTVMQVEKLRALFRPITVLPESAPSAEDRHYVDNRHPAPSGAYVPASGSHPTQPAISRHPDPSIAYLPPSGSHPTQPALNRHPDVCTAYLPPSAYQPTQPAAYVHYPSAYVPAQAAHLVPHEPYAHPYSHLPPPSAQFTAPAYYATPAGHPYQAGYESYNPSASAYHYAQASPSCYPYVQAQHLVSQHVPHPVYSTDPYFTANRDDPYRFDAVKSHYQETTSDRSAYGAAHENLQLVRQYGYTPSSETAAPEAATTNLGLVRSYGSDPSSATRVQSNVDGAAPTIYSYAGTPANTQAKNVVAPSVYIAAAAPAYL
ncbi:hypothetical protein QYE76_064385 [Lolium multiflorum]|uniref:DCD domain-containing protein n=1 Tax=Lolium multiflorum TaxID=4521 RepID=A0AAD8W925_LOLMU|nr:hypothetical protein QYE76_064385 [Lolium multiflorum]